MEPNYENLNKAMIEVAERISRAIAEASEEAIDLQDAAEIGEEQICRLKRAMLGIGSYARLVSVRLIGDKDDDKL